MKQTAVEFFEDELKDKLGTIVINKNWELLEQIIDQAKKKEKEQLCYFYIKGAEAETNNPYVTNIEFYNKTFKSE
jgi:hypothetical protein